MRQYIGARYVPKFMGVYDATQVYEALSVVDNGMGTSYISKIPTPAGTPLTDSTYWTQYGSASGAIINLQNQIDNINNTEIPNINSDIQALTDRIDSSNKLAEKKYVFVGDSYAASYDTLGCSWLLDFVNTYSIPSANYYDATYSGTGFTTTRTFKNNIEAIINNISDKDSITDVVVLGGINDVLYGTIGDIGSAINDFCTYCRSQFSNASISIGFVGNIINAHTEDMYNAFIDLKDAYTQMYNHLFEEDVVDVNADLAVLQTMLIKDGYKTKE